LVGIEICISFRGGVLNIGGEGQMIIGALAAITGLRPATGGGVFIDGEDFTGQTPKQLINRGVAYIPEKCNRDGMIRYRICYLIM
jgi:simple sugar transport system ATP-binding protein